MVRREMGRAKGKRKGMEWKRKEKKGRARKGSQDKGCGKRKRKQEKQKTRSMTKDMKGEWRKGGGTRMLAFLKTQNLRVSNYPPNAVPKAREPLVCAPMQY